MTRMIQATLSDNPHGTIAQSEQSAVQAAERSAPLIPGYEILEVVGRGGMGVVHRAKDLALNRHIAVKFLQPQYLGTSLEKRFLEEARITGQLQHPGVPPVHAVGTLPDGRPWLAMKLIEGEPLSEKQGVDALAVFEAIAHAVGYAHAHGIIHRDLKPANVMVGAHGEVQVMDWGLAKVMFRRDAEALPGEVHGATTVDQEQSQPGNVKGTPAFMPPEQAMGFVEKIDARSDVFGLGGILCWLLTGRPPFVGSDAQSSWQLAAEAKLQDAYTALDGCRAEPEVIALCKKCLSPEPSERYADGNEAAMAMAALRHNADERAKQAEVERGKSEVRRRLQFRLGSAIAATFLLGSGLALWQAWEARKQADRAEATAVAARDQASRADAKTLEAEAATDKANKATEQARMRYKSALTAYNQMVFGIQSKIKNVPAMQSLRKTLLENAKAGLKKLIAESEALAAPDNTLAWAHFQMGDLELELGNTNAAMKEYEAGAKVAGDYAAKNPVNVMAQRDLSVACERIGDVFLRLNKSDEALQYFRKSLALIKSRATDGPDTQCDLSVGYDKIGDVLLRLGKSDDALQEYTKSQTIRISRANSEPANGDAQRDLAVSYGKIGDVFLRLGKSDDALRHFQKSLAIRESQAVNEPENQRAQRELCVDYDNIGDVLLQIKKTDDALRHYRKSLAIRESLAKNDPDNQDAQRDLTISYDRLGDLLLRFDKPDDALQLFSKSLAIRDTRAKNDTSTQEAQRELSVSNEKIGDVLLRLNKSDEALRYYRESLTIREKQAKNDPNNQEAQRDLAVGYWKMGGFFEMTKEYPKAIEWYGKLEALTKVQSKFEDRDAIRNDCLQRLAACRAAIEK